MDIRLPIPDEYFSEIKSMIFQASVEALENAKQSASINKRYLSKKETMEYLGCSYVTLQNMIDDLGLPLVKVNNKHYIDLKDLHEFMNKFK